jgi:uncharacterized membrane protein
MPNPSTALTDARRNRAAAWKAWLVPVILGTVALALALVTRFVWIENRELGLACGDLPAPWWCGLRQAMWQFHQANGWGLIALGAGVGGLLFRLYPLALIGMVFGLFGIVLYNAGLAAVGLVAALLLVFRRR